MKKLFLRAGALSLVVLLSTSAGAASFFDTENSPYTESIDALHDFGILEGYGDGTFRPNNPVNRAELMKVLLETRFPTSENEPIDLRCFEDMMTQEPAWYAKYVCLAKELGIVGGYPDGTFKPERTVNLAEALKMTALTFGVEIGETNGEWYEPYLAAARERDVLTDLLQSPEHVVTRGEMAEMIHKFLLYEVGEYSEEEEENLPEGPAVCGNGIIEQGEQCDDGNLENEDGCSMICIETPITIRHGALLITQEATATITNVAAGKRDVPLMRFNVTAGRQDVRLTQLILEPTVGSLIYARNYTLAMDRDGNGTFETAVAPTGRTDSNRLIFDDLADGGVLLHEDLTIPFEIRADIAQSLGPFSFGIRFDEDEELFIGAVGEIDGRQLTGIQTDTGCPGNQICWIRVVTGTSGEISVTERGNLFVTSDNGLVTNHQALASGTSDAVFRITMRADREDIDVSDIRIEGGSQSVNALLLYKDNETQPFAQATNSQCATVTGGRFCAKLPQRTLVIPRGEEVKILVKASVLGDTVGGVSGQLFLPTMTDSPTAFPAVEARGISSSQTLLQSDGDTVGEGEIFIGHATPDTHAVITGKQHVTTFAKFSDIVNAGPANATLSTGQREIASFKFSAVPHLNTQGGLNAVRLRTLEFSVQAINVQLDPLSIRLSAKESPDVFIPCSGGQTTGSFTVTCDLVSGSVQRQISQGGNLTLVLSANVTNLQLSPGTSLLTVGIPSLGFIGTPSAIEWDDEVTTFQWVDLPKTSVQSTEFRL